MKPASVLIMIILLSFVGAVTGCGTLATERCDIDSLKSYRDIPGVTEEEIAAIETLKTERDSFSYGAILTEEAFRWDDRYAGFTPELCELLSDLFGLKFEPELYEWEDLKSGLVNKRIDFTGELTPTPERLQLYYMTHAIAERSLRLFTYGNSLKIEKETDLNGLKVGFLAGTITARSISEYYPGLSFEIIDVKDNPDVPVMLESGEIDAFVNDGVSDLTYVDYDSIRSKEFFSLVYTPVSITTANSDLEPVISVMNKYLAAGGIDKLYGLYTEGEYEYARYKLNSSFTTEERAYLADLAERDSGVSIGLEHDNYPVCFYNETDREFEGIAVDVLAEISKLTGLDFATKTTKNTTWSEIYDSLMTGEVSMVSQLLYSDNRKTDFIWSGIPYASSYYAMISKSDYPNLASYQVVRATVGVVKKTAHEDMYNAWFPGNNNTVSYDTQNEALDALEKGEIDLLMSSEYRLLTQTHYREKPGYKLNLIFNVSMDSLFGFNKNEEILCSIIDKALPYVKTDVISKNWRNRTFDYSSKLSNQRSIYLAVISVILFLALTVVMPLLLTNKRIRKDLEKQSSTLSSIFRLIPDLLYCKDVNCAYTLCNPSFEKFAGCEASEITGRNAVELFPYERQEMGNSLMETDKKVISECATKVVEEWFTYPDGTKRLFETIKTPMTQGDKVTGMLGISRDITEHKAAVEEALAASSAKSAFLAHMSHEIRTPMNAIVGMAELVLREDIPPGVYENVLGIKHASANLLSIINDILDFSKIEAGKLEIITEEYSFSSLINDVISIIRMRIIEKPLMFAANIDCHIPNKLIGDEARFRQILLNILGNAVKYTNEGHISLSITGKIEGNTVLLTVAVSDSGIGIKEENLDKLFCDFVQLDILKNKSILGTGLGLAISKNLCLAMGGDISVRSEYGVGSTFTITLPQKFDVYEKFAHVEDPANKQILVYEPRFVYADSLIRSLENLGVPYTWVATHLDFFQELKRKPYPFVFAPSFLFESAHKTVEGLGLKAKLILFSKMGEISSGQNFRTIAMPAHSGSIANMLNDAPDSIIYHENSEPGIRFIAPSARVLIVDDVRTNLKVSAGLMLPYKMTVDLCKSGAEAIELVQQNRYDLIFMDHMMPEMDGIEAVSIIRSLKDESGYYQNVPIVALTANAVSGMKEVFLRNGMNDFLAKPIEIIKLNSILEKWIPREKREQHVKEKTAPTPTPFEIDGIDVKTGIIMTGGMTDDYLRTLAVFYEDGLHKIKEIRACLEKNDINLYTTLIHALKGSSATIGAAKLSDSAKMLEAAGRNANTRFIRDNLEDFLTELETLLQNIKAALSNSPAAQNDGKIEVKSDLALLKKELLKLKDALVNMDVEEINTIIGQLEATKWDEKTDGVIRDIAKNILLFDYNRAIDLVNIYFNPH